MAQSAEFTSSPPKNIDHLRDDKARRAIERFALLFSDLTEEKVRASIDEVYARDAYLNDTLKEVRGVDNIREYFLETARAVESCQVEIVDVAASEDGYYIRWSMRIRFKKLKKGQVCESIGMSHFRISPEGKIAYHQDYWDAAQGLFEHVPVLGSLIRAIKRRI